MDSEKLEYFKKRLLKEKADMMETLFLMKKNGTLDSNAEIASEISLYDNHPGDIGDELADMAKNSALKINEDAIIAKIDSAIKAIDTGDYGVCKCCGKEILEERLQFVPYAKYCVDCQKQFNESKPVNKNDRPVEESVIGIPFFHDTADKIGFDEEDSYQAVDSYNRKPHSMDYFDGDEDDGEEGYVEPIEKISNDQYRYQLPD